jgi:hypothetical protein
MSNSFDEKEVEDFLFIFKKLGRAVSLSAVAGSASPAMEDHAIREMDLAWRETGEAVLRFIEKGS